MECAICVTAGRKNSCVSCPACEYVACKSCLTTFFGSLPEPKCANCNIIWTREFITTKFRSFEKEYLKMRQTYLLNREFAKLPETQPIVEQELMVRDLELRAQTDPSLKQVAYDARVAHNKVVAESSYVMPNVLMKCPNDTECRGFISSDTGKCGLCPTFVCKTCSLTIIIPTTTFVYDCRSCLREIHTVDVNDSFNDTCPACQTGENIPFHKHICKPEDIETVKLLKQETRPCPKCGVPISKIDGCDQMWCVQCKTAFSWITGIIETGRVHNPHFYEWQRQRVVNGDIPREDEDGCVVQGEQLSEACAVGSLVLSMYLHSFHNLVFQVVPYQVDMPHPPDNRDLRIKYLLNELSKTKLSVSVQRRDKKYQKDLEIFQILDVLCTGAYKIFRDICIASREAGYGLSDSQLLPFVRQLEDLRVFINNQLNIVGRKFKITNKIIMPFFIDMNEQSLTSPDGDADVGRHLQNLTAFVDPSSFTFNRDVKRIELWID